MLRLGLFPFMRPALAAMVGIAVYEVFLRHWSNTLIASGILFCLALALCLIIWWRLKPSSSWARPVNGTTLLLTCMSLGAFLAVLRDESRRPEHLLHQPADIRGWKGVVVEGQTRRPTYTATVVQLRSVRLPDDSWRAASGRIRVMVRRAPGTVAPHYGDVLVVTGVPRRVAPPANPGQFDYAAYLRYRQVWHEQFVDASRFRVTGHELLNPLVALSLRWAGELETILRRYVPAQREAGLVVALVLGVADDLAADLKTAYGATGTTHVLAVSGLHIGLVFSVIVWLLGGNNWYRRRPIKRFATVALILALIWTYALLTGLSASVLRAVVMTSLVVIGRAGDKRISLFNTLAVAALGLLVYNPFSLFDVGFQLSFLAVLSIAYIQPKLADRWYPQAWLPRLVWQAVTVALAAQLGTSPLTLYYFHQFPTQFLVANLLAVPWSNCLLYGCFILLGMNLLKFILGHLGLLVLSGWLDAGLQGWGWLLTKATYWLNETVAAIGQLPAAVITGIWLTGFQMTLLYAILIAVLIWLQVRNRNWLVFTLGLVALYVGSRISIMTETADSRLISVYAVRHHSAIGLLDGATATILTDSAIWADSAAGLNGLRANILPHLWMRGTRSEHWRPLLSRDSVPVLPPGVIIRPLPDGNRLLAWRGLKLLLLDQPFELRPAAGQGPLAVDYVIIHGRPRFALPVLAGAVACRWMIFDGSGPSGWSRRRAEALRQAGWRVHCVADSGAFLRPRVNLPPNNRVL